MKSTGNRMSASIDLTKGPIVKNLIAFALPIVAGNIIMQLYNVADSIIVGQFVGSNALAAVTVSFPIMLLFNALFMGLSMGANIIVAQYKGAKDYEAMERSVNNTFSLCIAVGAVITVLGIILSRPLLQLLGTPENILNDSRVYLVIVFSGTIGSTIYMLSNGLIRGLGDSRWPLYSLIMASVMNVVLDLVFVIVFGWGVAGAAIATAISQFFSGIVLMMRFIQGKYGFKLSLSGMKNVNGQIVELIFRLGVPASVQNAAMSLGAVIIQSFANNFGSDYIASNGIIMRVDGFIIMPMFGIGMAVTTFAGQNVGAGNTERAKKGTYKALQMTIGICVTLGVVLYFFGIYLMRAFTGNQLVLDMGLNGLRFLAFFYVFIGINLCVGGAIRGAGEANVPAIIAIISNLIRIPFAYWLAVMPLNNAIAAAVSSGAFATRELAELAGVGIDNYMGLFYSMGISMTCGAVMTVLYFMFGKWQTKGIVKKRSVSK
jgi:putative MATE family efflux protein